MQHLLSSMFLLIVLSPVVSISQADDCHFRIPPGERDDFALVFGSVIESVYCKKFASVPDNRYFRVYLASVYRGISLECDKSASGVPESIKQYAFPLFRQMIQDTIATNELSYSQFGNLLNSMSLEGKLSQRTNENYLELGIDDGRMIAKGLGCRSQTVRVLKQRLRELSAKRQNIDPTEASTELILELMHPEWRNELGR